MTEKLTDRKCIKGGNCEVITSKLKGYTSNKLVEETIIYKCRKCNIIFQKVVNGNIVSHIPKRRGREEIEKEFYQSLLISRRYDEYKYLKIIQPATVIRTSFKELLDSHLLRSRDEKHTKQIIRILKPHLTLIGKYLKKQNPKYYQEIIDKDSITILQNACDNLYILLLYSEHIIEADKRKFYPMISKIKNQSDNLFLYFQILLQI